jgi:hypothetical protein
MMADKSVQRKPQAKKSTRDQLLMAFDVGLIFDPLQASGELSVNTGVQSKTSWRRIDEVVKYLDYWPIPGGFRTSTIQ